MSLLSAAGITLQAGARQLCQGLELTLAPGHCWAVLGANGSGKSTLLHTLAGLSSPSTGSVTLEGSSLISLSRPRIARRLGLLLQESHDPFPATVLETALTGRHPHLGRWQQEGTEDLAIARQALVQMDLGDMEQRQVQSLSGGERRRLAIATLLTQQPKWLLLDEPLNHLDLHHQQRLLAHLQRLGEQGDCVVMVLHDPNQAWRYCDQTLLLYGDGNWESGKTRTLLTAQRLSKLYRHPMRHLQHDDETVFLPEGATK